MDARRAEIARNVEVTPEKVLADLESTRLAALSEGKYTSAVRCTELQGKFLKMFTDRIEHVRNLDEVSDDDLVALLREFMGNLSNDDIRELFAEYADKAGFSLVAGGTQTAH